MVKSDEMGLDLFVNSLPFVAKGAVFTDYGGIITAAKKGQRERNVSFVCFFSDLL